MENNIYLSKEEIIKNAVNDVIHTYVSNLYKEPYLNKKVKVIYKDKKGNKVEMNYNEVKLPFDIMGSIEALNGLLIEKIGGENGIEVTRNNLASIEIIF